MTSYTSYSQSKFSNLRIDQKFQQVGLCSVDFHSLTPTETAQFVEGYPMRWRINDRLIFTGFIKRVEKDDDKEIWRINAESCISQLRDTLTNIDKVYKNVQFTNIINDLLPSGWTCKSTAAEPLRISYHVTPGNVLQHITNLCYLADVEWEADQEWHINGNAIVYDDYILRIKDFMGSKTSIKHFYNYSYGTITQNIANFTCKKNEDKISTHVTAVGAAAESANLVSNFKFNTNYLYPIKYGENYSESYLNTSMTAAQLTIELANPLSYVPPCLVLIDNEILNITAYGVVARAQQGTTAAVHARGTDVLTMGKITLGAKMFKAEISGKTLINPATYNYTTESLPAPITKTYEYVTAQYGYLPADNGSVWIGEELVFYNVRTGGVLSDLKRGEPFVDDDGITKHSRKYAHKYGTFVKLSPVPASALSPTSVYGDRNLTVDVIGVTEQDGVDKKAQYVALALGCPNNYGSFTYLCTDFWRHCSLTLGDTITISKRAARVANAYSTETFDSRIIGIHYSQFAPVVVDYGDVDELILDDFAKADKAYTLAVNKNDNTFETKVLAVDANNSNVIQVQKKDGTTDWIKVV